MNGARNPVVSVQKGVVAIYTRGFNPPYTEGKIAAVRPLIKAIALCGWKTLVLNFRYSTQREVHRHFDCGISQHSEVRIPGAQRSILFHTEPLVFKISSSILESVLTPILLAQELRARPFVVHLNNCFKFPRALLRLISKKPVAIHVYQMPIPSLLPDLPLPVDAYLASSSRIAKVLKPQSHGASIFTFPPAVDTEFFEKKQGGRRMNKTVLYIGNLSPNRIPNDLLLVFREVLRGEPDASFRLIAPVSVRNTSRQREIETICRSLGIEKEVSVFLTDMDDDRKLEEYRAVKCFMFAPSRESHDAIEPPLTVLEALSCGLPVVATETYSVGESVTSAKNGFLVSPESYTDLVDRTIRVLQADEDVWQAWSAHARTTATSRFSISSMSGRLTRIYSSILT